MELHELQPNVLASEQINKMPKWVILVMVWYMLCVLISLFEVLYLIYKGSFEITDASLLILSISILGLIYIRYKSAVNLVTFNEIFHIILSFIILISYVSDKYAYFERNGYIVDHSNEAIYASIYFDIFYIGIFLGIIFIRVLVILYVRENKLYFNKKY